MKQKYKFENDESFTMKEAIKEAKRCLNCKAKTCSNGCPIENNIPGFIHELSKGNLGEARAILAEKTSLPAVCGRVCPHEKQCEGHCVFNKKGDPIKIGKLEQFIADFDSEMHLIKEKISTKIRGKIAIIGSGPAGLTVAGEMAREGFNVVVYEAESEPGGILLYGIPSFRLPKDVVKREIEHIEALGVTFITNCTVGPDITVDQLFQRGFDAIFIGTGTAVAKELDIDGKELNGVVQSSYFLRMITLHNENEISIDEVPVNEDDEVVVIGAGNVAMDASRTAKRFGVKNVTVVYRGSVDKISASKSEYEGALEDGVNFIWNASPIEYVGEDGYLTGLKVKTEQDEEMIIKTNKVLVAIGSRPANRIVSTTTGIDVSNSGYVITKDRPYGMTTRKGVFAGGDVVHKPATVVLAMKEAKKVAQGIIAYVDAIKLLEGL